VQFKLIFEILNHVTLSINLIFIVFQLKLKRHATSQLLNTKFIRSIVLQIIKRSLGLHRMNLSLDVRFGIMLGRKIVSF